MFQFPSFPSCNYVFIAGSQALRLRGSPIRISADRSLFAAPRSFSQLITSFVGSWCQGIHLMLFLAWTSLLVLHIAWVSQIIFYNEKAIFITFFSWFSACVSTCGQIVVFHDFQKDLQLFLISIFFFNPVKLSVRFSYLVFNEHSFISHHADWCAPNHTWLPTLSASGLKCAESLSAFPLILRISIIVSFPLCSFRLRNFRCSGGLKWSRTTDLMLIRHAL